MIKRNKITIWVICFTVLLSSILTVLQTQEYAHAATQSSWQTMTNPSFNGDSTILKHTCAISSTDAWVVGNRKSANGYMQPLIEHWDGSVWSVVSVPNVGQQGGDLQSITAFASNNVYAVGKWFDGSSVYHTLIMHWDGSAWTVVSTPDPFPGTATALSSISGISANDIWVVGGSSSEEIFLHWNGSTWTNVVHPTHSLNIGYGIASVTAIATNDVWAVGGTRNDTLAEHWNGTNWTIIPTQNVGNPNSFSDVSAISSKDVWAVGDAKDSAGNVQTMSQHWDGSTWKVVASPVATGTNQNSFRGISATAQTIWGVGGTQKTLVEQWTAQQGWTVVQSPNTPSDVMLSGVSSVPGTDQAFAVGYANADVSKGTTNQIILQYGGNTTSPSPTATASQSPTVTSTATQTASPKATGTTVASPTATATSTSNKQEVLGAKTNKKQENKPITSQETKQIWISLVSRAVCVYKIFITRDGSPCAAGTGSSDVQLLCSLNALLNGGHNTKDFDFCPQAPKPVVT